MKKTYREPELEITLFDCVDIVCGDDSNIGGSDDDWRFKPIVEESDM